MIKVGAGARPTTLFEHDGGCALLGVIVHSFSILLKRPLVNINRFLFLFGRLERLYRYRARTSPSESAIARQ